MAGFESGGKGFGAPDPEAARKRALGGYKAPVITPGPDPTFDATSVPAAVPLPTSGVPRTPRRSFGVSEGD